MEDEILDYFNDDGSNNHKIIAIKFFYFESKARLYAARLEDAGIPSFVSNTNAITAFPLGDAGIGLHIREVDREAALPILKEMDELAKQESVEDESFRDADHDEINYQRQLHEQNQGGNKTIKYLIAIIVILVVIRMLWRAFHPNESWDFF